MTKTMELQRAFISLMTETHHFYKKFLLLEQQKYDDLSHNRLEQLDERVKQEQAFMLRSRGLEQKREQLLKEMGVSGAAMREVITQVDEELQPQASALFDRLSDVLLDLKEINARSSFLAEMRIHRTEAVLQRLADEPAYEKLYNEAAGEHHGALNLISKKI